MDKKQLRDWARGVRAAIPDVQRERDSELLKQNVIAGFCEGKIPVIHNGGDLVVGTYYPIGTEIHPPHVIDGYQMALPVIRDKTTLEFYPWAPDMRLVKRDFDIPIPDTRGLLPVIPDVILLPLLLCDEQGNRIGYGAGHYDRYIASLDTKPILIGVCFDEQVYDGAIPAEPHDKPLDLIITPKRIIEVA